jgi:glycosyltransferase involved in cell wall biosynthesis
MDGLEPLMRVLHVIPSLSAVHGGPSKALPVMVKTLRELGNEVDVVTTDDDGPGGRLAIVPGATHHFPKQTEFYKVSLPMLQWLSANVGRYDVVHIHALFSFSSTAAAWAARWHKVPYVVRPLGVLNDYGMKTRRPGLKRLSFALLEQPILRYAAAMHYTSEAERLEAEANGAVARAAVIPLGLEEPQNAPERREAVEILCRIHPSARERERVLFLSRLDEKKGLETLLEAMRIVQQTRPKALLLVAGSGRPDYEAKLRQISTEIDVLWLGQVDGELKEAVFAAADVYVLPSHSENFGIAALEAMQRAVPSIVTTDVAVGQEMAERGGCLTCVREPEDIAQKIFSLLSDETTRLGIGQSGATLVRERYSLNRMGASLEALYQSLVSGS